MPTNRPAIPAPLARAVKEEAGYRCAIPACGQPNPLELAHITPWSEVQDHTFENLICLCANDHVRFDRGQIDRISIRNYKMNLSVINARYNSIERRILQFFADGDPNGTVSLPSAGAQFMVLYLIRDGLLESHPEEQPLSLYNGGILDDGVALTAGATPIQEAYRLTPAGLDFLKRWLDADPVI